MEDFGSKWSNNSKKCIGAAHKTYSTLKVTRSSKVVVCCSKETGKGVKKAKTRLLKAQDMS
jgi:hypothetical protein